MGVIERIGRYLTGNTIGRLRYRNNGLWVFGEWFGNRCCDNSLFFANYLAEQHPEIPCIWVSKKGTDLSLLNPRIKRVEQGSEAMGLICNAACIIVNQSTEDVSSENGFSISGPTIINLWHGIPWKKIGFEAFKGNSLLIKAWLYYLMIRKSTSYWLSLNAEFTEVFKKGFGAKEESIIRAGYPRNMEFYNEEKIAGRRDELLEHLKIPERFGSRDVKIITYMPTFRDHKDQAFSFDSIAGDEAFQRILGKYNAVIIQKAHFAEHNKEGKSNSGRIFAENDYPAALLLAATDILITDYSSCFFDYLLLDRPIIHYLYDYDYYRNQDRGLYYPKEEVVCGDAPENVTDLLKSLEANLENPGKDAELRKKRRERFMAYESADSCEKIFRAITAGKQTV